MITWDPSGVMASQAAFNTLFAESVVIAARTRNNAPFNVHESLTFLAQFWLIQRSWPTWAANLARLSTQLFVSLQALWTVLQQHEPRPASRTTAPVAPVRRLNALGEQEAMLHALHHHRYSLKAFLSLNHTSVT